MAWHRAQALAGNVQAVAPPCSTCGCTKTGHLSRCPLCGAELPGSKERSLNRWLRSGALEVAVFLVVAVVLVVSWLVVLSHR